MDFFGIGAAEVLIIFLLLFLFFGPAKLPEIAGMIGKAMRKLRQLSAEMNKNLQELSDEVKETSKEADGTVSGSTGLTKDLKDISKEMADMAKEVNNSVGSATGLTKDVREASREISSIARDTRVALNPKQAEVPKNPVKKDPT